MQKRKLVIMEMDNNYKLGYNLVAIVTEHKTL